MEALQHSFSINLKIATNPFNKIFLFKLWKFESLISWLWLIFLLLKSLASRKKKILRGPWNVGDWRIKVIFRIRSTFSLSRASERWISAKRTWKIIKLWLELITAFSPYCFCTISFPDICMFHKKPTVDSLHPKL